MGSTNGVDTSDDVHSSEESAVSEGVACHTWSRSLLAERDAAHAGGESKGVGRKEECGKQGDADARQLARDRRCDAVIAAKRTGEPAIEGAKVSADGPVDASKPVILSCLEGFWSGRRISLYTVCCICRVPDHCASCAVNLTSAPYRAGLQHERTLAALARERRPGVASIDGARRSRTLQIPARTSPTSERCLPPTRVHSLRARSPLLLCRLCTSRNTGVDSPGLSRGCTAACKAAITVSARPVHPCSELIAF